MAIKFASPELKAAVEAACATATKTKPERKRKSGHAQPKYYMKPLSEPGRLTVGHLMPIFDLSHSALYERIKAHRIPPPDGYEGKRPFWNTETILAVLNEEPYERGARIERAREERRKLAAIQRAEQAAAEKDSMQ
jgi:hypothetical protein